ncbi:MAG: hypothetical protein R2759_17415 [Bacteroidales bacterium]
METQFAIDLDLVMEKAKYYTGEKLQIAVLKNGTIIIFPEKVENIISNALKTLEKVYFNNPDFNPRKMDDGNYIIEYTQPAFTIVFKEEIEKHWNILMKIILEVSVDEVLINEKESIMYSMK